MIFDLVYCFVSEFPPPATGGVFFHDFHSKLHGETSNLH